MEESRDTDKFCIIVGAGVGGLIQAAELLRKKVLQPQDIQILERSNDYGGVWNAATYPGAACDVFSCMYQVSWHRNPDWNTLFPTSSELVQYYKAFADHYELSACTRFGQNVVKATWDNDRALWIVEAQDVATGSVTEWTAKVLIQAAGTYNRKSIPTIPGIETFKGDTWHTLDWPQEYDFTGKKVAYVGTGPTSVQVLPHLQRQAASVNVFCRSMTYCHPFVDFHYPRSIKWAFRWIPGLLAFYTFLIASLFGFWSWFSFRPSTHVAKFTEYYCRRILRKEVSDPILRQKLEPSGRFGAKRPLVSLAGYFEVLQKDNVQLIKYPIDAIDANGVITKSPPSSGDAVINIDGPANGETARIEAENTIFAADVLIWGTGFKMQGWGGAVPTFGRSGMLLSEHWKEGPKTLYGTMTSSFPNLLLVNGPNTVSPWASLIRGLEHQAMHNLRVIRHIRTQTAMFPLYAIEPTPKKEEAWTEAMQPALDEMATSSKYGPAFYYLSKNGRNTFFWPWPQRYYWWRTRKFKRSDYSEDTDSTTLGKLQVSL